MNQENATLQSADPKPPTRDKIRWFWFAFDIILILFIIAFIEFLIFALPLEGYYFGLSQGKIGNGTTLFATSLLLSPVALIAFLILIVRMFTFWPRHIKNRKNRIILQALTICVLIASIAFPSALVVPFQKNFTDGFQEHVQMADIEAIQQWVGAIDKELFTTNGYIHERDFDSTNWPDSINWPSSVTMFHPHHIYLALDENDNPKLELIWGGGRIANGLVIGHETLETPDSYGSEFYAREISQGVYIWIGD